MSTKDLLSQLKGDPSLAKVRQRLGNADETKNTPIREEPAKSKGDDPLYLPGHELELVDELYGRDEEGEGLAGSGLGAAHQVLALQ